MNNRPDWSQNPGLIVFLWTLALLALIGAGLLFAYTEPGGGHWDTERMQQDWSYVVE